jgi:hypothetical protein
MTHKDEVLKLALDALKSAAAELYRASSYCNTYEVIGNTNDAITAIQKALAAPVQEPVVFYRCNGCGHAYEQVHPTSCDCMEAGGFERVEYYTTLHAQPAPEQYTALEQALTRLQKRYAELEAKAAAQPAVPDAITDNSENPEYRAGWNDCRQAMMEMMK